jgi:Rod binding domain-containing protein
MTEKGPRSDPIAKDWRDILQPIEAHASQTLSRPRPTDAELLKAARGLEASFLAIMLREAGVGAPPSAFGGGSGEEQFTSFLTDAYAARISESGGIGLAERLFDVLKEASDDRP